VRHKSWTQRLGVRTRLTAYKLFTANGIRPHVQRVGLALANTSRFRFRNDPLHNGESILRRSVLKLTEHEAAIVAIDVGANVGDWSISLLREATELGVESRLSIVALEPAEASFETLCAVLADYENAIPRQIAASATNGFSYLNIFGDKLGINSLEPPLADSTLPIVDTERVRTTTLDSLVASESMDVVHLLKIDTEGHDFNVLLGAEDLFRTDRVWVAQFEYNKRWIAGRHLLLDVFRFLEQTSYSLGYLTPRGIAWTPEWDVSLEDWYEANFVIAHEGVVPKLPSVM
jgi:FkbM family methyltransferase